MRKRNIALGFYQNVSTARHVLNEFKKQPYSRAVLIQKLSSGKEHIERVYSRPFIAGGVAALLLFIISLAFQIYWLAAALFLFTTLIFWFHFPRLDAATINQYKKLLLKDETLVLAEASGDSIGKVLAFLREVKTGHPLTYLLRSDLTLSQGYCLEIPKNPLPTEALHARAEELARQLKAVEVKKRNVLPLIEKLDQSEKMLKFLRFDVSEAENIEQTLTVSAEWLLDNMYVIEGSIEDVRRNLPKKYYQQLPKLTKGDNAGIARIYIIAAEIVQSFSGTLTKDGIVDFLMNYQKVDPLTIGELWALPLMIRLRLLEWIQHLAIEVDNRMREGELANLWGSRLLYCVKREPEKVDSFLNLMMQDQPAPSPHFVEELLDHLFDEETILPKIKTWVESLFSTPIANIIHAEQMHETAEQVAFSSSIISLITLNQLSWPDLFETVCPIDPILEKGGSGLFTKMDFFTRNRYRSIIEEIAKRSDKRETEIAEKVLSHTESGEKEYEKDAGYYLIDKGRFEIEKESGYKVPFMQRLRRLIVFHPVVFYLGLIIALIVGIEAILLTSLKLSLGLKTLIFIFSIFPLSEIVIQIVNFFVTQVLPPTELPKMEYKEGIPDDLLTLIVVPTLLLTPESIKDEVHRLEIRYLANTDPNLRFSLFSDFSDSSQKNAPLDEPLLDIAKKGIKALNAKYGEDKFFLFHRQRSFSKSENAWIGWERKRGKLEVLTKYLTGDTLSEEILYVGNKENIKNFRYVITLDSDTQLPKDKAKDLVSVISHPLNAPYVSEEERRVIRGYTVIQPRICTDFSHTKGSWFSRIFSEPSSVDPYTQAISNVYQDLAGEGTYHGKGIFDLYAFKKVLSERFPESHLLSHDLLEGAFARVGFASDVCLFDFYPEDYLSWSNRQHRWIRGDFQIIDWLRFKTPTSKITKEWNPLSFINRWKIFDNLRRGIMPSSLFALLLVGWFFSHVPGITTALVAIVIFMPFFSLNLSKLLNRSFPLSSANCLEFLFEILRGLISIAVLPYEAFSSLDALIRVAWRRLVSKKYLLQWTPFSMEHLNSLKRHWRFLGELSLISILSLILLSEIPSHSVLYAWPFVTLWFLAPFIIYVIDKPIVKAPDKDLTPEEKIKLRSLARKTWRYFDDFVNVESHFLPPDNYQTGLKVELANRTSPTNIGMWFIALFNSCDFCYITIDYMIEMLMNTLNEMGKLEKFEGHFLNWYNTTTQEPLYPRYISTVDSGNLLASLWTVNQGVYEVIASPLIPPNVLNGLSDTLNQIKSHKLTFSTEKTDIENIKSASLLVEKWTGKGDEETYWINKLKKELYQWNQIISRYYDWLNHLPEEAKHLQTLNPSLHSLSSGEFQSLFKDYPNKKLEESLSTSRWYAGEKLGEALQVIDTINQFSDEMNLGYLYNPQRKLFAIGYNVDDKRLDTSYYDLLASEARISSLVAIAKGDVPIEHWWALGRPYSIVKGRMILLSWAGTMFEYLMPLIFNKQYPDSLLGEACYNVVKTQIDYGKSLGVPWGISEAAFSAIDIHKTYQYKSFGVIGTGLKRGLEKDLVVSPYSTALALPLNAKASFLNLQNLEKLHMMGPYGFYESIDFTRQWGPSGERGVIVYAFMVHHQGMILAAVNNVLNDYIIAERFHKDPRIKGVDSILYEKIPSKPAIKVGGMQKGVLTTRLKPFTQTPILGITDTAESVTPKVFLLSNGNYSAMVTNAGGGYSRFKDYDITRWRADTTRDAYGNFIYIKDLETEEFWSYAYHPVGKSGKYYSASFKPDKVEFKRRDNQIETLTEILVSPEDNIQIFLLTLLNHSSRTKELELTSYIELSLSTHAQDRTHPAFNKMFIETEALEDKQALLAFRRLRSSEEKPLYALHLISSPHPEGEFEYETDRLSFIGRGGSLKKPLALEKPLNKSSGYVLDPIFSLRKKVVLEPGRRVQLSFILGAGESRESVLELIEKYRDFQLTHRTAELSWTYSQLEMRHLRIHQEDVQLFQKLSSRIIYPQAQLRASQERIKNSLLPQSGFWAQGISGDFPIVVVTVGDLYDLDLVKQVLTAHSFWTMHGLKTDLIIINEQSTSYENPIQEQLQRLINAQGFRSPIDQPGGIFLRNGDKLSPDELNLILSSASAILIAARGSMRQQLVSPPSSIYYAPHLTPTKTKPVYPTLLLSFKELLFYNGFGGYERDGKVYSIYLNQTNTPCPWINVMANKDFGCIVSESGMGMTWFGNSQTNRLTSWSNDPIENPITDTVYMRDDETGEYTSITPLPIRDNGEYRINHGQGYTLFEHNSLGIEQRMTVFIPKDLSLRFEVVKLTNKSSVNRQISLFGYHDWVLGTTKEETELHLFTEWDAESQSLFAKNSYNPDYGSFISFSTCFPPPNSFTADRAEFLGRNQSGRNPAALSRKGLSGREGGALDPCSALQSKFELKAGEEKEITFVLGIAPDATLARELIQKGKNYGSLLQENLDNWDKILSTLQVETPDVGVNFYLNRWGVYQTLSCRFWGRSAFYQSSGAFGFRDQLQDSMALIYSRPDLAREQILLCASRQFLEGDVQHWWHPPKGGGVRTQISDDLLWLPFVCAHYVRITKDVSILHEKVSFLKAPLLNHDQHESYSVPEVTEEKDTVLEHCRRSLQKGLTKGVHGLPLMGGGDWNDGMNLVGIEGKGESVWLAWFLIHVMIDFSDLLEFAGQKEGGEGYRIESSRLSQIVEATAWDGEWYKRAYFDDGTPLGSNVNTEAKIDSLAQSWSVICGEGNKERSKTALNSALKYLLKEQEKLVLLLTPSFNTFKPSPGYIKGYPPGVRENGGQYTHGSLWLADAFAKINDPDTAVKLLKIMLPVNHALTQEAAEHYKVEPYAVTADVYSLPGQVGRGGWSWYTGAAAWMYRIWIEEILGFRLRGDNLEIKPRLPSDWNHFKLSYRFQETVYKIEVNRGDKPSIKVDGAEVVEIKLVNDQKEHLIQVWV